MYTTSIFMLLSWPLLIYLSWIAIRICLVFFENREKKAKESAGL